MTYTFQTYELDPPSRVPGPPALPHKSVQPSRTYTLEELVERLPKTADGVPITPGMAVHVIIGQYIDEREVIGPYGTQALLVLSPARHGTCGGSSHHLAESCYASRENAVAYQSKRKF